MLSTIRIIWDVKELLCLITCLVLWFGCVMYVLFNQYCRPPECDQSPYYGTIGLSFLSSFTILTTANFPDVMMSAYTYNRLFAIPFVLFLLFVSREAPHARNVTVTECRLVLASLFNHGRWMGSRLPSNHGRKTDPCCPCGAGPVLRDEHRAGLGLQQLQARA